MEFRAHEYQKRAIRFVEDNPYCCLFLDMGLGKTVSTLTAISRMIDDCEVNKVLVVAPKKVAESTWSQECQKWNHLKYLRVSVILGTAKQRIAAMAKDADIYVTGRDNFCWMVETLSNRWPYDMVVLDELTSFKTTKSQRFKAFKAVRPKMVRVVGLTGTPTPNGLKDLWGQMYCIDLGKRLGRTKGGYLQMYFDTYTRNNIMMKCDLKRGAEEAIYGQIRDIALTMTAEDYLTLPPLIETTRRVTLSDKMRSMYDDFERENILEFAERTEDQMNQAIIASSAAALMNKLMQFANGAIYADEERNVREIHDEKMDALMELIEEAQAGGESVLVFYQFQHDYQRAMQRKELKGLSVRKYEGDQDLVDWNNRKIDVLFTHAASTAYGLNLQHGGNVIVWYGTGFNAELYLQGNARLHRQGQTSPTRVYRLVVEGTVDEDAALAVANKVENQKAMLDALKVRMEKYKNLMR